MPYNRCQKMLITSSTNTYPNRAMLETAELWRRRQNVSADFCAIRQRSGRCVDSIEIGRDVAATNSGLVKRRSVARQRREFDVMGRLNADIFFQDRYLLNEVGVKIKLIAQLYSSTSDRET